MLQDDVFRSFFMAGFECASHRPFHGRRLNLTAASGHDRWAFADYQRAHMLGMTTARDGINWSLIEKKPGQYDFSSVLPLIRAARDSGVQVIWDLCHFGWPEDLELFAPEFITRFANLARAFSQLLCAETGVVPYLTPINEISYFSWACGSAGYIFPYARKRGLELKRQLVRAMIAGIEAIWEVHPAARIVSTDPAIQVHPHPDYPEQAAAAQAFHDAQYQARDLLTGRQEPELGGDPKYLDIVGVCYFSFNQWYYGGEVYRNIPLDLTDPPYRPLRSILCELFERYQRPLFIAETSIEYGQRASWLRYIADEVYAVILSGVPVEGICWYPILNHPGWDDDRPCQHGLWELPDADGNRVIYSPLAEALKHQTRRFKEVRARINISPNHLNSHMERSVPVLPEPAQAG